MSTQIEVVNRPETVFTIDQNSLSFTQKNTLVSAFVEHVRPSDRRNLFVLIQSFEVEDKIMQARILTCYPVLLRGQIYQRDVEGRRSYLLNGGESAIVFRHISNSPNLVPFLTVRKLEVD